MSRIPTAATLAPALVSAALAMALGAPLSAQESGEKVNQLIVFGDDPCPQSTAPDEITVCARKEESERFRIPEPLRDIGKPPARAWTDRVLAYESVGKFGTQSCSPVGAGGWTGCSQKLIQNAYAEKHQAPDVRFGELIAAERAKRLSTIDQDARETQARVEAVEREYAARQGSMASPDAVDARPAAPPAGGAGK
ncbi:MAG: hypothetical protein ABIT04_10305 [Novosphingobium sp.]